MKLSEQGVIILYRITGDGEAEIEREVTNEVAQLEADLQNERQKTLRLEGKIQDEIALRMSLEAGGE